MRNLVRRNALANYVGQSYLLIIAILITPFYLQYLGGEAYGLVGFFALMQAWLNLLDIGLTPTISRQVAYARAQPNGMQSFRSLLRSFEMIFLTIAVVVIASIYLGSGFISTTWLNPDELTAETIAYCITLMGFMIGFRWFASLYRSGINGMEDQVWLNAITIAITSLKFIGALLLLAFFTHDVVHFFQYQFAIGALEVMIMGVRFYSQLPETKNRPGLFSFNWVVVKPVLPFALGVAYTSGLWIIVTQVDKLVLSGILSLREFGYFSLAVLVASSIGSLTGPISQAIQPRMTFLLSQGDGAGMLRLYRKGSQLVALIVSSIGCMVAFFSKPLIYSWTGDLEAATWAQSILFWFALGNALLAVFAYQYYLQVAHGKLRLHVLGASLSALIDIPIVIFVAFNYGAYGVAVTWFTLRLLWFLLWMPVVHRQFAPKLHVTWLFKDILPVLATVFVLTSAANYYLIVDLTMNRSMIFAQLVITGILVLGLASLSSGLIRERLQKVLTRRSKRV